MDKTKIHDWQETQLVKYGWYAHFVDMPDLGIINCHTHGILELCDHFDLQIIVPLLPQTTLTILHTICNRIKAGEKFKSGDVVSDIIKNFNITFIDAIEGDRTVLRIILPDKYGNLTKDTMKGRFADQYKHLNL